MYLSLYLALGFLITTHHCQLSSNVLHAVLPRSNFEQYSLALEAIFGMGIRLHTLLDTSRGNFVVSPLSTTAVIGQLLLGAKGDFQKHLHDLLSLPRKSSYAPIVHHYSKNQVNQSYSLNYTEFHLQLSSLLKTLGKRKAGELFTLNLNNALFYNQNLELKSHFKRFLGDLYDTDIQALDFYTDTTG